MISRLRTIASCVSVVAMKWSRPRPAYWAMRSTAVRMSSRKKRSSLGGNERPCFLEDLVPQSGMQFALGQNLDGDPEQLL